MVEELVKKFYISGNQDLGLNILNTCISDKLYSLGLIFGSILNRMFPLNVSIKESYGDLLFLKENYEEAFNTYQSILDTSKLNFKTSQKIILKQKPCIEKIENLYVKYNKDNVDKVLNHPKNEFPLVTLTITTCKRFVLFEQTINSFLACCTDLDKIDKWIVVDDNSSEEDRNKMKELYPFFQFYFKTKDEKGHAKSMNIIHEMVDTPYVFHMEDDWKFFCKTNYISKCLDVLSTSQNIGQCIVNRNYMETSKDLGVICGGLENITEYGTRYYIHEYCPDDKSYDEFMKKYMTATGCVNCAYWPYFSFRPSLLKTEVLKKLGKFNTNSDHFEMEYSNKFKNNYVSAFMESMYCIHTGRLTTERTDPTKLNAYILNEEIQFNKSQASVVTKKDTNKLLICIVNLDRRPDRMKKLEEQEEIKKINYIRFPAVDGKTLKPTESMQRLFDGNDYHMQEGMVGCALSHLVLYVELLKTDYDLFCILEDDIMFTSDFSNKLNHVIRTLPDKWHLCYLGHHIKPTFITDKTYDPVSLPIVEKWDSKRSLTESAGGTVGYLISKNGAYNLLNYINTIGMTNCIDTMQQKSADLLNVYYCLPHLVRSECFTFNQGADTDIQVAGRSLTIPLEVRLEKCKNYYENYVNTRGLSLIYLKDRDLALEYVSTPDNKNVVIYEGDCISELMSICIYPCYTLEYKFLIVVPGVEKFERLKNKGTFDLSNIFSDTHKIISISGLSHVSEAIKELYPSLTDDYPFDKIHGGDLETFVNMIEITLNMKKEDLEKYVQDICGIENNSKSYLRFLDKYIVENKRYGISFPHDDMDTIVTSYTNKFMRLISDLKTEKLCLIYCTRWEKVSQEVFYRLINLLLPYNRNIKILVINALDVLELLNPAFSSIISVEKVYFPVEYMDNEWGYDKTKYDQEIFRKDILVPIKKFIE
jgi:GR25 family glycosyltransferase involved in LPS biosynthesis